MAGEPTLRRALGGHILLGVKERNYDIRIGCFGLCRLVLLPLPVYKELKRSKSGLVGHLPTAVDPIPQIDEG